MDTYTFDPHVHLHGLLGPTNLWEIGKDLTKHQPTLDRLQWYAIEMEKTTGQIIEPLKYWSQNDGYKKLVHDYVIGKSVTFSRFQASFNLIIALCPISPFDFSIQKQCLIKLSSQGVLEADIRAAIPFRFSKQEACVYLSNLFEVFRQHNEAYNSRFRVVLSISRDNAMCLEQLKWVQDVFTASAMQNKSSSKLFSNQDDFDIAVDFDGVEEGFPPKEKLLFCQKLKETPHIKLFYHVGESFEGMGLATSMRWIDEVQALGAKRLGHALALGLNPRELMNRQVVEPYSEYMETCAWIKVEFGFLDFKAFDIGILEGKNIKIQYDEDYIEALVLLQKALAQKLKNSAAVIECCPTSNLRIGQIQNLRNHPIVFFKNSGLSVVIGSDDPGIFQTTLADEHQLIERILNEESKLDLV